MLILSTKALYPRTLDGFHFICLPPPPWLQGTPWASAAPWGEVPHTSCPRYSLLLSSHLEIQHTAQSVTCFPLASQLPLQLLPQFPSFMMAAPGSASSEQAHSTDRERRALLIHPQLQDLDHRSPFTAPSSGFIIYERGMKSTLEENFEDKMKSYKKKSSKLPLIQQA